MDANVAETTIDETPTSKAPREVLKRDLLWDGGTVQITIPRDGHLGTYNGGVAPIWFYQFSKDVSGGKLNIFVHGDKPQQWQGKKLVAKAQLWNKALAGGSEFFYIDLHPEARAAPTYQLDIISPNGDGDLPAWCKLGERTIFEASAPPLRAIVVFTELKTPKPRVVAPSNNQIADGDAQLNRLLAEGWQVDREEGNKVFLWKMKGEKRRTMEHHRPKKR